jgi:hypothetical protein
MPYVNPEGKWHKKNGNTICNIAGPMIESIDDLTQEVVWLHYINKIST